MRLFCILLLIGYAAIASRPASASELGAPRIVGLGQAGAASAEGLDALGINPALIGLGVKSFELTLYPVGGYVVPFAGFGTSSIGKFEINDLQQLLNRLSVPLPQNVKQYIVDGVNLGTLTAHTEGTILATVWTLGQEHTIGAHITQHAAGEYALLSGIDSILHNASVSGNLFPLLLRDPVSAEGLWYNEYAMSYAYTPLDDRGISDVAFGVSVKYLEGLGYASITNTRLSTIAIGPDPGTGTPRIQTTIDYDILTSNGGEFNAATLPINPLFTLFPAGADAGVGADFGVMKTIFLTDRILHAALSVTDVGAITWNTSPTVRSVHRVDTVQSIGGSYAVDSLKLYAGTPQPAAAFSTSLPTQLHLAIATEELHAGRFLPQMFTVEYSQGLAAAPGNSTSPRIAAGAEWRRGIWRWNTGVSFNADEHVNWSADVGAKLFQRFRIDAAIGRLNGLWESPELVNAVIRVQAEF